MHLEACDLNVVISYLAFFDFEVCDSYEYSHWEIADSICRNSDYCMPYLRDYQKYCGNITCREACYKEIKKILENDAFHPKAISSYDYY